MADETGQADDSAAVEADALALAEQAEAEAAEAEALATAARARARAIALRRAANTAADPGDVTDEVTDDVEETSEEAEDASEETPEATDDADETAPRRRWVSRVLTAAAVAVICGLLALSGYFVWHHHTADQDGEQAAAFAAAARQELINLTSFDFNHAKEDVQRVIDNSTGEFRDDFQSRADDFTAVVEQSKVVTEGKVNAAAVESIDNDSAVVLVAASSNITNAAGAKEDPRTWRMRMTVTQEGDQYKVSKVEMVP